jgi:hypothetical protein
VWPTKKTRPKTTDMKKKSDDKKNDKKLYGVLIAASVVMAIIGFVSGSEEGIKLIVGGIVFFIVGIIGVVKSA